MNSLTFLLLADALAICRLEANAPIPAWATGEAGFISITRNTDELSIVCPQAWVPKDVTQEAGWRALKMQGPFDLSMTGVLAPVATALAAAQVNIFVVSTYDTDYVLVKEAKLGEALNTLESAGHSVKQ
jgi:uncharacterized protein